MGATVLSAHETFTVHGCAASGLSPRQSSAVVQFLKCDKEPALLLASQFLKSDKELAKNAGCSSYKPVPKTRECTVGGRKRAERPTKGRAPGYTTVRSATKALARARSERERAR